MPNQMPCRTTSASTWLRAAPGATRIPSSRERAARSRQHAIGAYDRQQRGRRGESRIIARMKRRWPFAAAAMSSSGRTSASGSSGSIECRSRRRSPVAAAGAPVVRTTRLNDGNEICGCGYQNAGRAAGSAGVSSTSPTTPTIRRCGAPQIRFLAHHAGLRPEVTGRVKPGSPR